MNFKKYIILCAVKIMLEEAERLHKDALKWTKNTFGEENILTAKHYGNLGRLYQSMKKYKVIESEWWYKIHGSLDCYFFIKFCRKLKRCI